MDDRIYTTTARELMTPDLEGKPVYTSASEVYEWMNYQDYHAAPLYNRQDEPVGYVRREHIVDTERPIRDYQNDFGVDIILSTEASFKMVLDALCQNYFYFLGGADELAGIITRADLNKSPVYIHLYERITRFEMILRDHLTNSLDDWTQFLKDGRVGHIEGRRKSQSDAALELINYTSFSDLITIACESGEWRNLGYDSTGEAEADLRAITDLRNDVAHRKLILYQDKINNEMDSRDVDDLFRTYKNLIQKIRYLRMQKSKRKADLDEIDRMPAIREWLKDKYGQSCQVCDRTSLAQICQILPLSAGGKRAIENMLVLCPNHHHEFDRGKLRIDPETLKITEASDDILIGTKLTLLGAHQPSSENFRRLYRKRSI